MRESEEESKVKIPSLESLRALYHPRNKTKPIKDQEEKKEKAHSISALLKDNDKPPTQNMFDFKTTAPHSSFFPTLSQRGIQWEKEIHLAPK